MDFEDVILLAAASIVGVILWQRVSQPAVVATQQTAPSSNYTLPTTAGIYGPATAPTGTICPSGQVWQQGYFSPAVTIKGQTFPAINLPPGCGVLPQPA